MWYCQSRTKRWSWPSDRTRGSQQAQGICSDLQAASHYGIRYRTAAEEASQAEVVLWFPRPERRGPVVAGGPEEERRNLAAEVASQHIAAVQAAGTFGLAETALVRSGLGRQEVAGAQHQAIAGIGSWGLHKCVN